MLARSAPSRLSPQMSDSNTSQPPPPAAFGGQQNAAVAANANGSGSGRKATKKKKRKHSFDSLFDFDSELDEFDTQAVRFKPESLDNLLKLTKFNKRELKHMYRGFKQLCPSGVVKEDKFKLIYAQFFPRGAETNAYARLLFNSFDTQRKQEIIFTDFVVGLSTLTRGTIDERLRWIFALYDINGDGVVTRDELNKIVCSVHDLMGRFTLTSAAPSEPAKPTTASSSGGAAESKTAAAGRLGTTPPKQQQSQQAQTVPILSPTSCENQAENLFKKFDLNEDGMITLDEFIEACHRDENIMNSMLVFNTII